VKVLRISHSAVVTAWRRREECLEELGAAVTLATAKRWREAGGDVNLEPKPGERVFGVATLGQHPCGFLYDPVALWRLLRTVPHDLLDVHEEPYSVAALEILFLRWLAARLRPMVLYSAQNLPKRHPLPVRFWEQLVLRSAQGAYPCNEGAAVNLRRKGFRGTVQVLPLGVELVSGTQISSERTPEARVDGLKIGCAGRLVPEKGFHIVMDAMAAEPSWSLRLVGEGPERGHLTERAKTLGIADRVEILGYCDEAAMAAFYGSVDVLVVPSVPTTGWEEQFGRVVVEAMAGGVPVVSSTCGSLPEVVGDAGLLVPPGDVEALHACLAKLAMEPATRHALAARGLGKARSYSWAEVARQQLALYRDVLRRGRASDPASQTPLPPLEVVIVAYRRPELLSSALVALRGAGNGDAYALTIVDNSSDGEIRRISDAYGAHYVDPGRNLGFAAAVNFALGARRDVTSDVLLLNPDAEVGSATVEALRQRLHAESRLSCVAPAQVDQDGRAQRVAWPFPSPLRSWAEALGFAPLLWRADFLVGSVLLLNGLALKEVGSFDERFFLYAEETDWQRRARRAGWGVRLCPDLKAIHIGAASSDNSELREALFFSAQETYLRKWYGPLGWALSRAAGAFGAGVRSMLLRGDGGRFAKRRVRLFVNGPTRLANSRTRNGDGA